MNGALALALWLSLATQDPCAGAGLSPQAEAQCARLDTRQAAAPVEREALEAVFERPDFAQARQRNTSVLSVVLERLKDWLLSLAETRGAESYSNTVRVVVLGVAFGLFVWVLLRVWRRRAAPAGRSPRPGQTAPLELGEPEAHFTRAGGLLEVDPRGALREALLGLLSALERRRYARPDRVKTNAELARELAPRGAPADVVARVTPALGWFDETYYSLAPVSAATARDFLGRARALCGALPEARR